MTVPAQSTLLVSGAGIALDAAEAAWRNAYPERDIRRVELTAPDQFNYDIGPLKSYAPGAYTVFLALSNHAINFARLKVMSDIKLSGYRMEKFISPRAAITGSVELGENSFVADGAVLGAGCVLRHNCYIGPRVILGNGVKLGHSVWIEAGAIIGDGASVGDNTNVGKGAIVADGAAVGRHCELLLPREYRGQIPEKTFYTPDFPNPVRIYRSGAGP